MTEKRSTVLVLDDDPSHLKIYSWIVEQAGCRPLTVQVNSSSLTLPGGQALQQLFDSRRHREHRERSLSWSSDRGAIGNVRHACGHEGTRDGVYP
jgi:hypothetical protein